MEWMKESSIKNTIIPSAWEKTAIITTIETMSAIAMAISATKIRQEEKFAIKWATTILSDVEILEQKLIYRLEIRVAKTSRQGNNKDTTEYAKDLVKTKRKVRRPTDSRTRQITSLRSQPTRTTEESNREDTLIFLQGAGA